MASKSASSIRRGFAPAPPSREQNVDIVVVKCTSGTTCAKGFVTMTAAMLTRFVAGGMLTAPLGEGAVISSNSRLGGTVNYTFSDEAAFPLRMQF